MFDELNGTVVLGHPLYVHACSADCGSVQHKRLHGPAFSLDLGPVLMWLALKTNPVESTTQGKQQQWYSKQVRVRSVGR